MGWFCNFSFTESHVKKDNFIESFIFFPFKSNLKRKINDGISQSQNDSLKCKKKNKDKNLAQGKMQRIGVIKSRSLRY